MVDRADLERASVLSEEMQRINTAIANFDSGGTIVAMTVSGVNEPAPPGDDEDMRPVRTPVTIPTGYIEYPPPMKDAIVTALRGRYADLNSQLTGMGVTGLSPPSPQAAQPPPAAPPRAPMASRPPGRA